MRTKVLEHHGCFIRDVMEWITRGNVALMRGEYDVSESFRQYVESYDAPNLTDDDFQKRKRSALAVPLGERCVAKRSNNEQCSRRRKGGGCFCGTHAKGSPFGEVCASSNEEEVHLVDIRTVDICGVFYYVDGMDNVYSPEDILGGVTKPTVIGRYANGSFHKINVGE